MRLEVHVQMGGDVLSEDETGGLELVRILGTLHQSAENATLLMVGDEVPLEDSNGQPVGYARLVPDWSIDEQVWVTSQEGALIASYIHRIESMDTGFTWIVARQIATHEPLTPVLVDHHGRDHRGRPCVGRMR